MSDVIRNPSPVQQRLIEQLLVTVDEDAALSKREGVGAKFDELDGEAETLADGDLGHGSAAEHVKSERAASISNFATRITPQTGQRHNRTEDDIKNYYTSNLLWIASQTRPDIAYAVSRTARMSADLMLRQTMWTALMRIYWAGDASRRSTTGFVLCYNGAPIMWSAKLQTSGKKAVTNLPAMSSGEAEYNGLAFATREVASFRNLQYHCDDHADGQVVTDDVKWAATPPILWRNRWDFTFDGELMSPVDKTASPTTILSDATAAISMAYNPITTKTRHVQLRAHFVKAAVSYLLCRILKVDTKYQIADPLTKPVDRACCESFRTFMNGETRYPETTIIYS
eukprot:g327.t1